MNTTHLPWQYSSYGQHSTEINFKSTETIAATLQDIQSLWLWGLIWVKAHLNRLTGDGANRPGDFWWISARMDLLKCLLTPSAVTVLVLDGAQTAL